MGKEHPPPAGIFGIEAPDSLLLIVEKIEIAGGRQEGRERAVDFCEVDLCEEGLRLPFHSGHARSVGIVGRPPKREKPADDPGRR
jgi:hypothetical protein